MVYELDEAIFAERFDESVAQLEPVQVISLGEFGKVKCW